MDVLLWSQSGQFIDIFAVFVSPHPITYGGILGNPRHIVGDGANKTFQPHCHYFNYT
jgi:hypothetical protein